MRWTEQATAGLIPSDKFGIVELCDSWRVIVQLWMHWAVRDGSKGVCRTSLQGAGHASRFPKSGDAFLD